MKMTGTVGWSGVGLEWHRVGGVRVAESRCVCVITTVAPR